MRTRAKKRSINIQLSLVQVVIASVLALCIFIAAGIYVGYHLTTSKTDEKFLQQSDTETDTLPIAKGLQSPAISDDKPQIDLSRVANAVNVQRQANNLAPLLWDSLLDKSAQDKCSDMVNRDYWSHNAPDGTEPWVFIQKYNVYRYAGENLAYGFSNEQSLVNGWMKSQGHRENILRTTYTNVGYATCVYDKGERKGERLVVQFLSDDPTRS